MKQFISIFVLISIVLGGMNVFQTVRAQGEEDLLDFDGEADADLNRTPGEVAGVEDDPGDDITSGIGIDSSRSQEDIDRAFSEGGDATPSNPEGRDISSPSPESPEGRMADGEGPQQPTVIHQGILPSPETESDCEAIEDQYPDAFTTIDAYRSLPDNFKESLLGCAVKNGRIRFWMVPFFITRLIQFLLGLAGAISMLFILVGGYKYIIGGLTDDKESGKKTLTYAVIGLIVSLSAWVVINVIQYQVTR